MRLANLVRPRNDHRRDFHSLVAITFGCFREERGSPGFYEIEHLRGGWSVRHSIDRLRHSSRTHCTLSEQSCFDEKGQRTLPEDRLTAEEEIKDPMVLEFLAER